MKGVHSVGEEVRKSFIESHLINAQICCKSIWTHKEFNLKRPHHKLQALKHVLSDEFESPQSKEVIVLSTASVHIRC